MLDLRSCYLKLLPDAGSLEPAPSETTTAQHGQVSESVVDLRE